MGFLWTVIAGFIVGVIAKFLHPGNDNIGFVMTVLLGVGGSVFAAVVGQAMGWYQAGEGAGFIASVIFSIILLFIYGKFHKKS